MANTNGAAVIGSKEFICTKIEVSPDVPGPEHNERTVELTLVERSLFCCKSELEHYLTQIATVNISAYCNARSVIAYNAVLDAPVGEIQWDSGRAEYSIRFRAARNSVSP
jgi:hypothetical protein